MPLWAWLLLAIGVASLVAALLLRPQLRFAMKLAKALATDERLPKPLRWAIGIALAVKVVPVPDFGIDEIILAVIAILLITIYRPTFQAILAETRGARPEPDQPHQRSEQPTPPGATDSTKQLALSPTDA
jgi:hypothetical protein